MSNSNLPERLQQAISESNYGSVHSLLQEGADLHECGSYGVFPLTLAARYDNPRVIEMLLEAGAEINKADDDGYTALMEAANCMIPSSLRLLIERGAEVNAASGSGATALIYGVFALGEDYATPAPDDVVAILLANGADLAIRDSDGKSALDVARETGNEELVEFLIKAEAY